MPREAGDATIGAPVRLRTKTGLPRHLTIMALPGFRLLMSISRLASASTSAEGFICARNLTATRRPSDAPIKRAPPAQTQGVGGVGGGRTVQLRLGWHRQPVERRWRKRPGFSACRSSPSASATRAGRPNPPPRPSGQHCVRQRLTDYGVVVGAEGVVVVTHANLVLCHRLTRDKLVHVNRGS